LKNHAGSGNRSRYIFEVFFPLWWCLSSSFWFSLFHSEAALIFPQLPFFPSFLPGFFPLGAPLPSKLTDAFPIALRIPSEMGVVRHFVFPTSGRPPRYWSEVIRFFGDHRPLPPPPGPLTHPLFFLRRFLDFFLCCCNPDLLTVRFHNTNPLGYHFRSPNFPSLPVSIFELRLFFSPFLFFLSF